MEFHSFHFQVGSWKTNYSGQFWKRNDYADYTRYSTHARTNITTPHNITVILLWNFNVTYENLAGLEIASVIDSYINALTKDPKYARAIMDCAGDNTAQIKQQQQKPSQQLLSFKKGDIILIDGKRDTDYYTGTCNGQKGIFQRKFVRLLVATSDPQAVALVPAIAVTLATSSPASQRRNTDVGIGAPSSPSLARKVGNSQEISDVGSNQKDAKRKSEEEEEKETHDNLGKDFSQSFAVLMKVCLCAHITRNAGYVAW